MAKDTSGLGLTPRSMTREPVERSPETTAARNAGLDRRVSRPMTTGEPPHHVPNAQAKFTISSGVSASPDDTANARGADLELPEGHGQANSACRSAMNRRASSARSRSRRKSESCAMALAPLRSGGSAGPSLK